MLGGRGAPLPPCQEHIPWEPPEESEEAQPHLALTQMSTPAICHLGFVLSPSGFSGERGRGWEGEDGKWWNEDFQASEFCPPSVRGHGNKTQLCRKKEIVKGHHFHFPCEPICFQEMRKVSPHNSDQMHPHPNSARLGALVREPDLRRPFPPPPCPSFLNIQKSYG